MDNENVTQDKNGNASSDANEAILDFNKKKYVIKRLKAGAFYRALKVYMTMLKEVTPQETSEEDKAKVDLQKLLTSMFESWPEKKIEFISLCCEDATTEGESEPTKIDKQFIEKNAYPDEIDIAFNTCMKLNKVKEHLKNSAAPIGELGGEQPQVQVDQDPQK